MSDDEDTASQNISPEIAQQIGRLINQALSGASRNELQSDGNRSRLSQHVRQRHEFKFQLGQGLRPSVSSSDLVATKRGASDLTGYMLEIELNNNRRFERLETLLDRKQVEIDNLNATISGLKLQLDDETEKRKNSEAENAELREKVKKLEQYTIKSDADNAELREKVEKLEQHTIKCDADNAELREEVKKLKEVVSLLGQDIAFLLKEKEKRIFNS